MARRTSQENKKIVPEHPFEGVLHIYGRNYNNIECYPRPGRYIPPIQRVNVVEITGECSICKQILTKNFPDDYPDEWKFCCRCKRIAEYLIKTQAHKNIILTYGFRKILNKITLVGK